MFEMFERERRSPRRRRAYILALRQKKALKVALVPVHDGHLSHSAGNVLNWPKADCLLLATGARNRT